MVNYFDYVNRSSRLFANMFGRTSNKMILLGLLCENTRNRTCGDGADVDNIGLQINVSDT